MNQTKMTIQEAAHRILTEQGQPLHSRNLAQIALDRELVSSSARDPIGSLSQTIEKNIRPPGINNRPRLVFVYVGRQRLIGLPGMETGAKAAPAPTNTLPPSGTQQQLSVRISGELMDQLRLAERAKIAPTFDDSVAALLREGLKCKASQIQEQIALQLRSLSTD